MNRSDCGPWNGGVLLPLLALCSCEAAPQDSSHTMLRLAVGKSPGSILIADFNKDGHLDLVAGNQGSDDIHIYLGDGSGQFHQADGSPVAAGESPNDLAVGDFNFDGKQDLAVANHETKGVTILLGNGHGQFQEPPYSPVQVQSDPHVHGIAAGDFNGDGLIDLAVESWSIDRVEILSGMKDGGFLVPGKLVVTGDKPYQKLRAADIDQNGKPEIITTSFNGGDVTIVTENDRVRFSVSPNPFGVAALDWNADGKTDLAIAHYSGSSSDSSKDGITILIGDGKGSFSSVSRTPFSTCKAPLDVAGGDVNGDGVEDVIAACYVSNEVGITPGSKVGKASEGIFIRVGSNPEAVAAGDLNGDGKTDIVTANSGDDTLTVLLSK